LRKRPPQIVLVVVLGCFSDLVEDGGRFARMLWAKIEKAID
jgi:hypothetical protein